MRPFQALCFAFTVTPAVLGVSENHNRYELKPFKADLGDRVPRMLDLIRHTELPEGPEYPGLGDSAGISYNVLKGLKKQWLDDFDWKESQASINKFRQFTANIEGLTIHFVHERSKDPNAIPLLLNHEWPGSFLEFAPIIIDLTKSAKTSSGKRVSFHAIVPSLPGFAFSSAPPANWTVVDTSRVYNTLMTDVLGYDKFAVHGTDYGAAPAYILYNGFNQSTRAAHFSWLPFLPYTSEQLASSAYVQEQSTKPNTIGLALYDNPVGQLSWMGEKFIAWFDPRAGTGPSVLTHHEILRSISLYYLTKSFISSCFIYYQNAATSFSTDYIKANTDPPMLYSAFKYNTAWWPRQLAERVGNLVSYRNHDFGGHFPALDNPPAMLEDLREIGEYWKR